MSTKFAVLCYNSRRRRRRQRKAEEAVAYVLHTARSWAQLRASPADRPQSEQIYQGAARWREDGLKNWPQSHALHDSVQKPKNGH